MKLVFLFILVFVNSIIVKCFLSKFVSSSCNSCLKIDGTKRMSSSSLYLQLPSVANMIRNRRNGGNLNDNNNNDDEVTLLDSVVRISCIHNLPDYAMPWQRYKQESSTSSGFVISKNRILTNAHAVEYGSLIQVRKRSSVNKVVARVVAVGHECDLAILEIINDDKDNDNDSNNFFDDTKPMNFGEIPSLQEEVRVVGYPVGGDSISISSGVVSRIEMTEYAQASSELLAIQIDACINPGNSGGPVINDRDEVIGVAFQSLSSEETENIGYVVPVPVIQHFLNDVEMNGRYSGVCELGAKLQPMESSTLRKHYGMSSEDTGCLVLSVAPLAPASKVLIRSDVLMAVDDIKIANDGTIPFRAGAFRERVGLGNHFAQRFPTDACRLTIMRDGRRMDVITNPFVPKKIVPRVLIDHDRDPIKDNSISTSDSSTISTTSNTVASVRTGGTPSYLVVGGLVLTPLSMEYMEAEFDVDGMNDLEYFASTFQLMALTDQPQREEGDQIVLLSQVLAHPVNIGYENLRNQALKTFNGIEVRSLQQLKSLVETVMEEVNNSESGSSSNNNNMSFEFITGQVVVLDTGFAASAAEELRKENNLPALYSEDLQ